MKRLLDRCGTLLLRDVPPGERGTLTSYKEMEVRRREINLSDCPEGLADMIESGDIRLNDLSKDDRARYELLVEQLDSPGSVFRMNHASNYLDLRGTLNADKDAMLAAIRRAEEDVSLLRPEGWRGI